jgi:hypothetical protein
MEYFGSPSVKGSVMDLEKQKFILTLLEYPEETAVAEYKSAIAFDPKSDFVHTPSR